MHQVLHGEQYLELYKPLPTSGMEHSTSSITPKKTKSNFWLALFFFSLKDNWLQRPPLQMCWTKAPGQSFSSTVRESCPIMILTATKSPSPSFLSEHVQRRRAALLQPVFRVRGRRRRLRRQKNIGESQSVLNSVFLCQHNKTRGILMALPAVLHKPPQALVPPPQRAPDVVLVDSTTDDQVKKQQIKCENKCLCDSQALLM